jgi:C-terminal processing protease CtpA/Prc
MTRTLLIILMALAVLLPSSGCKNSNNQKKLPTGKLGIVVPNGEGRVKKEEAVVDGVQYGPYRISGVYKESPAWNAGLRPGDIIIAIDNTPIAGKTYSDVYQNFLLGDAGTSVTLLVKRKDKQLLFHILRGR